MKIKLVTNFVFVILISGCAFGIPDSDGYGTWHSMTGYTFHGHRSGSGIGTIEYSNGDVYEGEVQSQAPDGYGKLATKSGEAYVGYFSKGRKDGWVTKFDGKSQVISQGVYKNDQLERLSSSELNDLTDELAAAFPKLITNFKKFSRIGICKFKWDTQFSNDKGGAEWARFTNSRTIDLSLVSNVYIGKTTDSGGLKKINEMIAKEKPITVFFAGKENVYTDTFTMRDIHPELQQMKRSNGLKIETTENHSYNLGGIPLANKEDAESLKTRLEKIKSLC